MHWLVALLAFKWYETDSEHNGAASLTIGPVLLVVILRGSAVAVPYTRYALISRFSRLRHGGTLSRG